MTITTYPSASASPSSLPSRLSSPDSNPNPNLNLDLAILNLSRLFTRLEHNLLSPSADLTLLHRSEYQRMRIGANVEYARTLLNHLERNLPTLKDRRHELQADLPRKRQTLALLQDVLDNAGEDDTEDDEAEEEEILLDEEEMATATPAESTSDEGRAGLDADADADEARDPLGPSASTASLPLPLPLPSPSETLRYRGRGTVPTTTATATAAATEETLSAHRIEQEDLTTSLLGLASQLKASSQAFQSSLEAEKSVLARAVEGLDRTTTHMDAAEKRMGMLRRMTEGKGWWGRMMLYAWIFGLWLVAVLIVFLGPKLRF